MKRYRDWNPGQLELLPPSPRDWLPSDHLVFFILELLMDFDLSEIEKEYQRKDPRGTRPYHPRMMLGLILYGYCRGVRSSRKLERATYEDVAFRVLTAGQHPDHSRISEFRRKYLSAIQELFVHVLKLCERADLTSLVDVALDGTKLQANASKHKAMSYEGMLRAESELEEAVRRYLEEAEEIDRAEDELYGKENRGDEIREDLRDRETRKKWIKEQLKQLRAEAAATRARDLKQQAKRAKQSADNASPEQAKRARTRAIRRAAKAGGAVARANRKARAAGQDPPKLDLSDEELPFHQTPADTDGNPRPRAQRNFTDPDSRIMKQKGAFLQGYNCQIAVDADSQVIVSEAVTNHAPDSRHLKPMLDRIEENTGRTPKRLSADAGYFSEANVEAAESVGTEAYIATSRKPHSSEGPPEEPPEDASPAEKMAWKLQTEDGREIYAKRKVSAEPVFGQIKEARGVRRFLLRGLEKVRGEWSLICLTHNILKLFRAWRPGIASAT